MADIFAAIAAFGNQGVQTLKKLCRQSTMITLSANNAGS
jgi:hypothetical protein